MAAERAPSTPAVRALRAASIGFTGHTYEYKRFPGAQGAAEFLGIDPHETAKTIVFSTDTNDGVVVLMHGDREVSVKKLARALQVKTVRPATQKEANRLTGYRFGGTSPLGMRSAIGVYAQPSIALLEVVYVNAGRRGFIVGLSAADLLRLTGARLIDVAVD